MLNHIIDRLELDDRISGWQVREARRKSTQLFLNKEREEARRIVDGLAYEIEVLVTRPAPKGRPGGGRVTGNARFNVDPSGAGRLREDLDAAVEAASLVSNEAYSMTEVAGIVPKVDLADVAIQSSAEAQVAEAAEALRAAAASEAGVRLVAAEFFADSIRTRYFNSQGVNCLFESTLFSGEFCLLGRGAGGEAEVFRSFRRRRLPDVGLASLVAEAARMGRERGDARLPRSGTFDVVFSGEALDHLFAWVLTQASAAARYNRLTSAEIGQRLVAAAPGASPLTLSHNALIPWAVGSYKLDPTGSPGCRRVLVENGTLRARHANARYAQYLRQAATGELGNVEVAAGKYALDSLLEPGARPLVHLSDFSYFEPNGVTGEFSSEIRYGREITASGSRPVKGGSVSGLTQVALATARFSSETEQRERYLGPRAVRLENLTLSGE